MLLTQPNSAHHLDLKPDIIPAIKGTFFGPQFKGSKLGLALLASVGFACSSRGLKDSDFEPRSILRYLAESALKNFERIATLVTLVANRDQQHDTRQKDNGRKRYFSLVPLS